MKVSFLWKKKQNQVVGGDFNISMLSMDLTLICFLLATKIYLIIVRLKFFLRPPQSWGKQEDDFSFSVSNWET